MLFFRTAIYFAEGLLLFSDLRVWTVYLEFSQRLFVHAIDRHRNIIYSNNICRILGTS